MGSTPSCGTNLVLTVMTFAQSRLAVLKLLRKFPFLRGFKSTEFNPGYVYAPYMPLFTTTMTPAELAETRRQLAESTRRVEAHIAASLNVDLLVR